MTHFEIVRTGSGWHARLRSTNGRIIMSSENYARRDGALNAVAVALEAAGIAVNRPPTPDAVPGRYLGRPLFADEDVSFDIRDVDERPEPVVPVIEWPVYHRQTWRPGVGHEDFWHDRDTHWRHCYGDECDEAIPPAGVEVACRLGKVRVTRAVLKGAGH